RLRPYQGEEHRRCARQERRAHEQIRRRERRAARGGVSRLAPGALGRVALIGALCASFALHAQIEAARSLDLEGGERIAYTLRTHPANAHLARPAAVLAPTSALDAARLLNLHLSTGDIEEAALLSNAPRRRF